jgi:hypothetical protein
MRQKDRCHVAGIKQHPSEHGCGKPEVELFDLSTVISE